jgi:hypothetical protein
MAANTLTKIATLTAGSGGVAGFTFSSIPQTYSDLKVVCSVRSAAPSGLDSLSMWPNGVQTNLSNTFLTGTGSVGSSSRSTYRAIATINSEGTSANFFTNTEIYIPNYRSSNFKQILVTSCMGSLVTESYSMFAAELWSNSAAITSLLFNTATSGLSFVQNSSITLYGIKNT